MPLLCLTLYTLRDVPQAASVEASKNRASPLFYMRRTSPRGDRAGTVVAKRAVAARVRHCYRLRLTALPLGSGSRKRKMLPSWTIQASKTRPGALVSLRRYPPLVPGLGDLLRSWVPSEPGTALALPQATHHGFLPASEQRQLPLLRIELHECLDNRHLVCNW